MFLTTSEKKTVDNIGAFLFKLW